MAEPNSNLDLIFQNVAHTAFTSYTKYFYTKLHKIPYLKELGSDLSVKYSD